MVLESLGTAPKSHRSGWQLFVYGVLYASIGLLLGYWFFRDEPSLVIVFFTVLAMIPLMYTTIKHEERQAEKELTEKKMFKSHGRALFLMMALFAGMLVAFTFWYVVLPHEWSTAIFKTQLATIASINGGATGQAIGNSIFMQIVANNIQVLILCLFFSFFYGAGVIFILTWNASVIAAATGTYIRNALASAAHAVGWDKVSIYFGAVSIGLLKYMTHGVFEILAYFIGGLAGGIISIAVIRHELYTQRMKHVIRDVAGLMLVAIGLVLLGAFVEVFITPVLF